MSCRICLEVLNQPASLPCGHIFCTPCIVKTVQAVIPYTHIHPCPICRLPYNIAPLDIRNVPTNLRSFVTPSVRKVFLNTAEEVKEDDKKASSSTSTASSSSSQSPKMNVTDINVLPTQPSQTSAPGSVSCARNFDNSSELTRLRVENDALRNHCSMWRRRAEIHGEANLGLLKFARAMRDQMAQIARDRNELEERCFSLKRMLDGDCDYNNEMDRYRSCKANATKDAAKDETNAGPDRESSILPPLIPFARSAGPESCLKSASKRPLLEDDEQDLDASRKKLRLSDLLSPPDVGITIPGVETGSSQVSYLEGRRRSV
ncbi:hypothetical protein CPB83DRAFT_853494 [Crepidotus variabilis]|uniref:RING-type domain-containing protein n=1 Tax=Crepidotus variabilis TaxID=179855 RepID=A0A9P6EH42_9AGAR|nr:hypothetical protein CPB83DRAFT_853494 [Crepidotus variabilis]